MTVTIPASAQAVVLVCIDETSASHVKHINEELQCTMPKGCAYF